MRQHHLLTVAMAMLAQPLLVAGVHAQNAQAGNAQTAQNAANGSADQGHPDGISSGQSTLGTVYVDAHGMTLYVMKRMDASFRSADFNGLKYCRDACARTWTALAAPSDAKPMGLWSVVDGAQGPQWAFKNDPVFTYTRDKTPGSATGDGSDDLFVAIAYVPPVPRVEAPANVAPLFADGGYILADSLGHALYTSDKAIDGAQPLSAGMASLGVGDWTISHDGDRPHWAFHGKPVYVSQENVSTDVPAGGAALRP